MGHSVAGTFTLKREADYNAAVQVCWQHRAYVRPTETTVLSPTPSIEFLTDSDVETKLLASLNEINSPPSASLEAVTDGLPVASLDDGDVDIVVG